MTRQEWYALVKEPYGQWITPSRNVADIMLERMRELIEALPVDESAYSLDYCMGREGAKADMLALLGEISPPAGQG